MGIGQLQSVPYAYFERRAEAVSCANIERYNDDVRGSM